MAVTANTSEWGLPLNYFEAAERVIALLTVDKADEVFAETIAELDEAAVLSRMYLQALGVDEWPANIRWAERRALVGLNYSKRIDLVYDMAADSIRATAKDDVTFSGARIDLDTARSQITKTVWDYVVGQITRLQLAEAMRDHYVKALRATLGDMLKGGSYIHSCSQGQLPYYALSPSQAPELVHLTLSGWNWDNIERILPNWRDHLIPMAKGYCFPEGVRSARRSKVVLFGLDRLMDLYSPDDYRRFPEVQSIMDEALMTAPVASSDEFRLKYDPSALDTLISDLENTVLIGAKRYNLSHYLFDEVKNPNTPPLNLLTTAGVANQYAVTMGYRSALNHARDDNPIDSSIRVPVGFNGFVPLFGENVVKTVRDEDSIQYKIRPDRLDFKRVQALAKLLRGCRGKIAIEVIITMHDKIDSALANMSQLLELVQNLLRQNPDYFGLEAGDADRLSMSTSTFDPHQTANLEWPLIKHI